MLWWFSDWVLRWLLCLWIITRYTLNCTCYRSIMNCYVNKQGWPNRNALFQTLHFYPPFLFLFLVFLLKVNIRWRLFVYIFSMICDITFSSNVFTRKGATRDNTNGVSHSSGFTETASFWDFLSIQDNKTAITLVRIYWTFFRAGLVSIQCGE